MRKTASALLAFLLARGPALGQYGSAPAGNYPPGYGGDIFSGTVTAVDESTQVITITHETNTKTEVFTGKLQAPCAVSSADRKPMTAADLPVGTIITAYFEEKTHKEGAAKSKVNYIIGIMFHTWDGHPVKQESKRMYLCHKGTWPDQPVILRRGQ